MTLGLLSPACYLSREDDGEVLATKTIGPEGGEIAGGGLRVVFPPLALAGPTEIEIRASKSDLSAGPFEQQDNARAIFPDGQALNQPVAVIYEGASAVLYQQDGLRVAAQGNTGYVNELGITAAASSGTPRITTVQPDLAPNPEGVGAPFRDTVHYQLEVHDISDLQFSMTLYDTADAYDKPLNGTGSGECGLQLEVPIGASVAEGCTTGLTTAALRPSSTFVEFDAVTFLAGKLDTPVTVGVVAGDDEVAYLLGFHSFQTDPCFGETCSGHGMCDSDSVECTCDPGFADLDGDPLSCECVPVCDGRECGDNSCGGQCGPGCDNDTEVCNNDIGQCEPAPIDTGSSGTDGADTVDGGMDTGDTGDTGMDSGGTDSAGSSGSSGGTGMGSSSTG